MKKKHLFPVLFLGAVLGLGFTGCSDDDDNDPVIVDNGGGQQQTPESILAVGFDTDRPVKRIVAYGGRSHKPESSLNYTWVGKNITRMSFTIFDEESNQWTEIIRQDFLYQGKEVISKFFDKGKDNVMVEDTDMRTTVQLDDEGYAASFLSVSTIEQEISTDNGNRNVHQTVTLKGNVERDAQHRVTKYIQDLSRVYDPADLEWMESHGINPQRDERLEHPFSYDADGNQVDGPCKRFTEHKNKNGFFLAAMHAFQNPRSMFAPFSMGPYDLFNVVQAPYLPAHFEHELYKYEFDQDGYVTKVYNYRECDEDLTIVPYYVFEY